MLLSIIVPVAPNEISWLRLMQDFGPIRDEAEILIVCGDSRQQSIILNKLDDLPLNLRVITALPGRAEHLNAGAEAAQGDYLWFIHADSQIPRQAIRQLKRILPQADQQVFYFDLKFFPDGPRLMEVNEWGVWFRSRFFTAPFGDQAFLVSKSLFNKIGPYPVNADYGEDHLWIWQARHKGIAIKPAKTWVMTSARKYQQHGWLSTTGTHLRLFSKQYLREFWHWLKRQICRLSVAKVKL
ncbi:Uncharacterised protein [BD1-7 clade bacterium]|uniref:Glycosyltransferase 2-like domain-containing protein n=1 Tax=BD1-7 clade bacterium TaxID=2029982 RepID=A0A5S9MZK9_9GAMM|nr:Uncharacterised protein [BD1-7 clade bacterium]CAA0083078.1 Uncharacterised protein [BD1-7 clade bacterium]